MIKIKNIILGLGVIAGAGVSILSLESSAAEPGDVTVTVSVNSEIKLTIPESSKTVSVEMDVNASDTSKSTSVLVSSNTNGYKLYVQDLVGDGSLKNSTIDSINPVSSTTLGDGEWGIKVDEGTDYLAVPGSTAEKRLIKETTKESVSKITDDETKIYYGFDTREDQTSGDYTATITFTATTNS